MIRRCNDADDTAILDIINAAAQIYKGIIPEDRWPKARWEDPYMEEAELREEIAAGVVFWAEESEGALRGVMGLQDVKDVAVIRHAYVAPEHQRKGVGGRLLSHVRALTERPLLIGTWAAATWAIDFYARNGFALTTPDEKERLLRTYWSVPERQIETSVVLADERWRARQ